MLRTFTLAYRWAKPSYFHCQHHKRILDLISLARERSNLKFEVWFLLSAYHFLIIIKSKTPKLNQHQSETICINYPTGGKDTHTEGQRVEMLELEFSLDSPAFITEDVSGR